MTATAPTMEFRIGDLVRARGREWVVLPGSSDDLLHLRPLGGMDEEVTAILPDLETVNAAVFEPPSIDDLAGFAASKTLLQAARLSTRSASGPFRSFGRISVDPRPYQLVPLLMALRQEVTRLLIADDVGIGKTVEAALVAKELLERGEANGLVVLSPAHLAEQWKRELEEKFHIDVELVLPSTVRQLESRNPGMESVFKRNRFVVVSIDFIKSNRRIDDFVHHCPDLVIVDEAHSCSLGAGAGQARHQRNKLVARLAEKADRHLILVTATPHSGKEEAFRSLIGLLDEGFSQDPDQLPEKERNALRRRLAQHLVQRRRGDILEFLGHTNFPVAEEKEVTYRLSPAYRKALEEVLDLTHGMVGDSSGDERHQRVRWWSALALLRTLASSPAAAAASLRNRADNLDEREGRDLEAERSRAVLDQDDPDAEEASDLSPASGLGDELSGAMQKRMRTLADQIEKLKGPQYDHKLRDFTGHVKEVLASGGRPIVFCRFIDTAKYVQEHLRQKLPSGVEVVAVTGGDPPQAREEKIAALSQSEKRVLVCTDCLSEGVNLQHDFDAVLHYDLSWNPTRHEQREGRVDRFGQASEKVRVLTYHGEDNLIDVVVLKVLLRKARAIRSRLGVAVSLPSSTSEVIESLYSEVLARMEGHKAGQLVFDFRWSQEEKLHTEWEERAEAASRTVFAQKTVSVEEVQRELEAVQEAIGAGSGVADFVRRSLKAASVPVEEKRGRARVLVGEEAPKGLRAAIGRDQPFEAVFEGAAPSGVVLLSRTHPVVEGLASWVLDTALDPETRDGRPPVATRCGVATSQGVERRSNLLLLRLRFHLYPQGKGRGTPQLAEEILPVAYTGKSASPTWLDPDSAIALLDSPPAGNTDPELARNQAQSLLEALPKLEGDFQRIATERAAVQRESHARVRFAGRTGKTLEVEAVLPVDVLGAYVLLPAS